MADQIHTQPQQAPSSDGVPVKVIPTAGLLVVKANQLLLAFSKNKKAWYLPGGKTDQPETSLESLIREVEEELGVRLTEKDVRYYYHISAPAYGEAGQTMMEQDCFLGPCDRPYQAQNEIGAIRYFSYADYKAQTPIVPGVIQAFEKLISDGKFQ